MRHLIIFISFLSMVWSSAVAQTYTGRIEDSENLQQLLHCKRMTISISQE